MQQPSQDSHDHPVSCDALASAVVEMFFGKPIYPFLVREASRTSFL